MASNFSDKTILVTGGSGSLGHELTEYLQSNFPPQKLIIFSRDEMKQFDMAKLFSQKNVQFILGDVRDKDSLKRACANVDYIIHAAAIKHVSSAEYNPFEAVKTNILGAQNVIDCAVEAGVQKVVALSTDKAVNPVNLYGATKLCADKIFLAGNAYSEGKTQFSIVRYGNVVGSRGSVVPIFLEKRKTGTLPVTDERMTRFWISLRQSVQFILRSMDRMLGGEVFVPKLPSMRVVDLAKAIAPECRLEVVGIRPGEKLHETLISEFDSRHTYEYDDFFVILPDYEWYQLNEWQLKGGKVVENFSYSSVENSHWLDSEAISKILETLPV
ncbi:MAG: UDP-N-acetylglucosamine 4,6-dehydratase (inverting) [Candidatus Nitrohelix vancouverensis]|uniref:UDP-N-acetylglucosamine 4,6-dehydratase (Inverting) n=1 Tax=Candidatus Nitrohelix vancouverensis TaxID=2705534 RepID=A0A7T0G2B4_9BACT|nr:MAG: UDP-N-acetylglucosamine 4,6-dehydratase (inverting) [Candidatus Nitrohelix vancouverensis]